MREVIVAEAFIYQTLSNDSALIAALGGPQIFSGVAPVKTDFPIITFHMQSGIDDSNTFNGIRPLSNMTYMIKVIGQTQSLVSLLAISKRVDTLLHRAFNVTITTPEPGLVLSSVRTGTLVLPETLEGVSYRSLGGFFDILVQST